MLTSPSQIFPLQPNGITIQDLLLKRNCNGKETDGQGSLDGVVSLINGDSLNKEH